MNDIVGITEATSMVAPTSSTPRKSGGPGFGDTLKAAVNEVNRKQLEGDRAIEKLQTGESQNIHEVMLSVEKADISLRLAVQMRNKALEAYKEIMRTQV